MGTTKKTVAIEDVRAWVNTRLTAPDSAQRLGDLTPDQAFRLGAASLLEQILHATGNYKGFAYTGDGNEAGLVDDSRRYYYGGKVNVGERCYYGPEGVGLPR
jgi:hypothetical protein